MAAYDAGLKRGKECLQAFSVEQLKTTTVEEYCALGRLDAKQRYKREDAQREFMLAWYEVGASFATLFKPSNAETIVTTKLLEALQSTLRRASEYVERLRDWEPPTEYIKLLIDDTGFMVVSSIEDITELLERLRQPEEQG